MVSLGDLCPLTRQILNKRGYRSNKSKLDFLNPDYGATNYDPMLLPDMNRAVERLLLAAEKGERVTIYCDYDVDGTTAAALLLDALPRFNLLVDYYVPDRFAEGYGLNRAAIDKISQSGTQLILTVDNGIVSFDEVEYAKRLGIDVIITDHHTPRDDLPAAVAVVDPKILVRDNSELYNDKLVLKNRKQSATLYPFADLCGCGVAFKLVQALQLAKPEALPAGQEKWLLDLVALATVSDIVGLTDENRAIVYWGLRVIAKTRRPGVKALSAVAGIELSQIDSRAIGFMLGPRINAAGRLAHASLAIELLSTQDNERALELAGQLNQLNSQRKSWQGEIYEQAIQQINTTNPVAIAVGDDWHEGVVGIVASKIEETVERPTFVCSRHDGVIKGSGRSFGDFSIAAAINATSTLLEKGGGHAAAGGITIAADNFVRWCQVINDYYASLKLTNQTKYLYPAPDIETTDLAVLTVQAMQNLDLLEPFGEANPAPVIQLTNVIVVERRLMGASLQHVRYTLADDNDGRLQVVAFNSADRFLIEPGEFGEAVRVNVLIEPSLNEWNGDVSVQGKLLRMERV